MSTELKWFYDRGNKARLIVYCIDPWVLFSPTWNEYNFLINPVFYNEEPFSLDYAYRVLNAGGEQSLNKYVRAKMTLDWLNFTTSNKTIDDGVLHNPTQQAANKRISVLYDNQRNEYFFRRYSKILKQMIALARSKGSKFVLVSMPTLLSDPGHEQMRAYVRQFNTNNSSTYFDFSKCIEDRQYFSDYDHLNTKGIVKFVRDFLKPSLIELATRDSVSKLWLTSQMSRN